jgi:hypothetical protein
MDKEVSTHDRLNEQLAAAARLRMQASADPSIARKRNQLREWQSQRLAATHADLLADKRYHAAAAFFLDELYGTKDTTGRDADVARVVPTLSKFLPESGVETVADAMELDALSEDLDAAMAVALGKRIDAIDAKAYGAAYRSVGRRIDRVHQVDLIDHLGHALEKLTKRAFAGTALKMMRKPAAAVGLSDLQAFLESGYNAFRAMGNASEFLEIIVSRERAVLEGLFAGNDGILAPGARF